MRVLIATEKPFAKVAVDGIRKEIEAAGFELVMLEKYTEKKQLLEAVSNVDAIIIRSDIVDAEVIAAAKNLKIVVRAGAGYDNVDLDAASKAGVCVMNTPGQNSNAVAELVLGLMVYAARNFFDGTSGTELKGKKLGLHGYGNIGRNAARIARGFGMEVYAFRRSFLQGGKVDEGIIPVKSPEELYETCQYISLHVPSTAETKGSINYELMKRMPEKAVIINTARKEIINEADLVKLMEERQDFKYLSDIMPGNHAEMMEKFPKRYFSTPKKLGAQTAEANNNAGIAAAQQIVGFLVKGDDTFRVNK